MGASACCINKKVIPEEALKPLTQIVFFNGLISRQHATHGIKQGSFLTEENKFKIPLIYAFDMRDINGNEMLIGADFLRSMKGGIRIEGDEITIYKKVTRIKTLNQTEVSEIAELEVSEKEFLEINESIYFNQEGSKAFLGQFKPVIDRKHVDSFLKIGAIRLSKSRHRTMAMIVNSGTTIDPITGKEVERKERMVFNYNSLNNNTYKDQYSLPSINTIIKRIGRARIFSKFDLKLGFHQVNMDEKSIPWTTFLVPGGLYEWLVMPFGLKNAPAVFQRKMNKCFQGTESFIAVYIDDILVFSKNEKEHANHLERMLKICKDNGLVLSLTKMKITVSTNHIPKLGLLIRPLYEKTNAHGDKRLKPSDYELVRKIKEHVQNLPDLEIPPWIKFADAVIGTGVKINIEHIEGKHNTLVDSLSRLVNLCGGSSTVPLCLLEEYEDYLRRSHEDSQPLPRIFTKAIFIHKEPGALYKHYQLKANQASIRMDKSNAWRAIAQDIEVLTAKEIVKAM
nr:retrotransposon protein, putative, Ty3-gypsy subclass [Tanacetum cinerariifolium]